MAKTEAQVEHEKRIPLDEIGKHEAVDLAEENIDVKSEAFANDLLLIEIHPSGDEGSLDVVTPSVNAINQPIIRGVPTLVKRKYVEALARSRTTKYRQEIGDPRDPSSLRMVERTVLSYPFVVHKDPAGAVGKQWLKNILAQQ